MANNVPLSTDVPKIYVPSLSAKQIYVPHIKAPHLDAPFKSTAIPRSAERRHVKDLGDIILGNPITGTRQLQHTLEDYDQDWVKYVPLLNRIVGVGLMAKERVLQPLAKGEPGAIIINTLESLGSSLDILANPIKSLIPSAGGGDTKDLYKSMGWLDDSYRETYQWDTGNFLVDFIGEVVSDPTNWLTLGGKSVLKLTNITDDVLKMTDNALIKTFGKDADELVTQLPKHTKLTIISDAADDIVSKDGKIVKSLREHITDKKSRALIQRKKFTKGSKHYEEADKMFRIYSRMARLDKFDVLEKELANLRMSTEYKWYSSINKAIKVGESIDRAVMTATEVVLPQIGFSHVFIKYGIIPAYQLLHNKMVMDLKDYPLEDIMKNPTKAIKYLKENVGLHDDIANKQTYLKMVRVLKDNGLEVKKIHDMWMTLYYDTPVSQRTNLVQLRKRFVDRLIKEIPILKTFREFIHQPANSFVLNGEQLAILKKYKLTIKDIADFVDSVMARGTTMVDVDILVPKIYKQGVDALYDLFKKRHVDEYKAIKEVLKERLEFDIKTSKTTIESIVNATTKLEKSYEVIYHLKFIDDQFLRIDNKKYGLANLRDFLKDAYELDPERGRLARELLDYFGINVNNVEYVINTINNLDTIIKVIEQARFAGQFTLYKQLNEILADEYLDLLNKLKANQKGVYVTIDTLERSAKNSTNLFKSANGELYVDINKNPIRKLFSEFAKDPDNNAITEDYLKKAPKADKLAYENLRYNMFEALGISRKDVDEFNIQYKQMLRDEAAKTSSRDALDVMDIVSNPNPYTVDDYMTLENFVNNHISTEVSDWLIEVFHKNPMLQELLDASGTKLPMELNLTNTVTHIIQTFLDDDIIKIGREALDDKALPDIAVLADDIINLQNYLKSVYEEVGYAPKSIIKFIDAGDITNSFSPKFKNLYKDFADLRKLIQSKYSMFATIMSHIHRLDNFSEYYNQLSLTDSSVRQSLEAAIGYLIYKPDEVSQRTANYLREILAKVDSSNVLENVLGDIKLPSIVHTIGGLSDLGPAMETAIKDLFYSTIYEFRYRRTGEMYDLVNVLVNRFMNNFDYNIKPALVELLKAGDTKYIPEGETLNTIIDAALVEFKSTVRTGFEDYTNAMLRISHYTGIDLPFLYTLDNRAINIVKQLRMDYTDILNTMQGYTTYQEGVHDLIQNFAGGVSKDVTDEVLDAYKAQADLLNAEDVVGSLHLDINLDRKYIDSFETAMYNAYNEIYAVNKDLSKGLGRMGRTGYFKGVAKRITKDTAYYTIDKLNRWALEKIFVDNAYALSLFTSTTAKKVNPKHIIDSIISLDFLNPKITDDEYKILVETYQNSRAKINTYKNMRDNVAEVYRLALTEFFSEPRVNWGPKSPDTYFKHLTTEDLYIWNDMVRGGAINKHYITYDTICKKFKDELIGSNPPPLVSFTYDLDELQYNLDYAANPKLFIDTIDDIKTDFTKLHDDNVWGPMSVTTANYQLELLFDRVEESLYRTIKDPKSLQQHQQVLIEHQKRGVGVINNLRTLVKLERDTTLVKDIVKDEESLKVLRGFGITPEMPMNSKAVLKYMTDETHQMFKNNFLNFTPKQVRKYLEDYTLEGKLIYINTERNISPFENIDALKEAGVGLVKDDSQPGVFMLYTLAGEYETENIKWNVYKSIFPKMKRTVVKAITDSQQTYTWGTIDIPYELFDGLVLYRKQYDTIMRSELFKKLSQKALHFSPVLGLNNSIKNSIGLPNFTIVGGTDSYMTALDLAKEAFKKKGNRVYPMYYSKAITRRVSHGLLNAIHTQDQKIKYLSLFLNEDYSLGGPLFRRVFANATDQDIEDIFSRNNFVAAVVKQDSKGQPKIYKIHITNKKQLEDAIKAKAIVLPHEVYRNMVLTINDYKFDNKFMQIYERTIMFAYKTIYLSHPGTLMRNAIDSMVVKPSLSTDGLASMTAHFAYQHQATKLLEWYNKIHQEVFDLTEGITFNRRALSKVLKKYSAEERYWYAIVDTFVNSSASGGNSEAMMAFWKKYNFDRAGYAGFPWEKYIADAVAESPRVQWVQSINNHIEQSARLGMLLYQLDNGYNIPMAIRNIIGTHFDYALKDDAGYLLERLFWFSTFSINNLMYYVNVGLTKNPNVLDAYMDALELSWNDGEDYTWDEVKDNPYLTYWATLGHIRFRWDEDTDFILKTGSSFMDFFNIIFGLNQEFQERLNPFLSVLLGFETPQNLNPWNADISYAKQFKQGRSLVPSAYTTINRYKDYKKKHKIEKQPYISSTSSWRIYPKRLPNRRTKPIRSRFAYTRNWRQYTRYFHRNSNPPQWTYRNSRQHHIPSRYIRNQKIRI